MLCRCYGEKQTVFINGLLVDVLTLAGFPRPWIISYKKLEGNFNNEGDFAQAGYDSSIQKDVLRIYYDKMLR